MRAALLIAAWALFAPLAAAGVAFTLERSNESGFANPHDLVLAPDGRHLYVADLGNDVIRVLDPTTLELRGNIGQGELRAPHDVVFDRAGRLLVADSGNNRIAVYDVHGAQGRRVAEWRGGLDSPEGVAVGADGRVYVTSAGGHTITVFLDGKVMVRAGQRGDAAGEYRRPHDIVAAPDGRLYVADSGNHRIQILDAALKPVKSLLGPSYRFNEPKYLAFDEHGWLYIADEDNHQVKVLDASHRLVATLGSGRAGRGPGELRKPEGVEVRNGKLWISDTYNHRILLYRLTHAGVPAGAR